MWANHCRKHLIKAKTGRKQVKYIKSDELNWKSEFGAPNSNLNRWNSELRAQQSEKHLKEFWNSELVIAKVAFRPKAKHELVKTRIRNN